MNYRGNIRDAWHELDADGSGKAGTLDIARLWDIETASRPRSELDWPTAEVWL